jgi:hypothetical protein
MGKARGMDHVHVRVEELGLALRCPDILLDRPPGGGRLPAVIEQHQPRGLRAWPGFLEQEAEEGKILGLRAQRRVTTARSLIGPVRQIPAAPCGQVRHHHRPAVEDVAEPLFANSRFHGFPLRTRGVIATRHHRHPAIIATRRLAQRAPPEWVLFLGNSSQRKEQAVRRVIHQATSLLAGRGRPWEIRSSRRHMAGHYRRRQDAAAVRDRWERPRRSGWWRHQRAAPTPRFPPGTGVPLGI